MNVLSLALINTLPTGDHACSSELLFLRTRLGQCRLRPTTSASAVPITTSFSISIQAGTHAASALLARADYADDEWVIRPLEFSSLWAWDHAQHVWKSTDQPISVPKPGCLILSHPYGACAVGISHRDSQTLWESGDEAIAASTWEAAA